MYWKCIWVGFFRNLSLKNEPGFRFIWLLDSCDCSMSCEDQKNTWYKCSSLMKCVGWRCWKEFLRFLLQFNYWYWNVWMNSDCWKLVKPSYTCCALKNVWIILQILWFHLTNRLEKSWNALVERHIAVVRDFLQYLLLQSSEVTEPICFTSFSANIFCGVWAVELEISCVIYIRDSIRSKIVDRS